MAAAENLTAFQEFAAFAPPLELLRGKEMVIDAVLLPRAGRSGRGRDAQRQR
jgi:hypothetical protein